MKKSVAHSLNECDVPVGDNLFDRLVHSKPKEAFRVVKNLPLENRAALAAFCYSKRHMNHLGLLIASTCDRMALRRAFGMAGDVVYKQSRDVEDTMSQALRSHEENVKITLASSANVVPIR